MRMTRPGTPGDVYHQAHTKLSFEAAFNVKLNRNMFVQIQSVPSQARPPLLRPGGRCRLPGRLEKDFTSGAQDAIPTGLFLNYVEQ